MFICLHKSGAALHLTVAGDQLNFKNGDRALRDVTAFTLKQGDVQSL